MTADSTLRRSVLVRFPGKVKDRYPSGFVAALGNFDGIHRGHQEVLRTVVEKAKSSGTASALISFHPHPREVLQGVRVEPLHTLAQKLEILSSLGIDLFYLIRFTPQVASLGASTFISDILLGTVGVRNLCIGPDACLGRNREATTDTIVQLLEQAGAKGTIIPWCTSSAGKPSSSEIRRAIASGDIVRANELLGRPYELTGRIRTGDGRGRTLGVPTLNLSRPRQLLPSFGVYAGRVEVDGSEYPSVANIGMRPTFGGSEARVECHVLDNLLGELYGKRMKFRLLHRLREERRFDSPEELVRQIQIDAEDARRVLSS